MNKRVSTIFFLIACAVVLWLVLGGRAKADEVTLTWTNPTDNEQCTAGGTYDNPAGTRIWQLVADITDPTESTFTLPGYLPGDYTFVATSYSTDGVGSRISGEAEKTVTAFTAAAGSMVYQVVSISGGFWLLPVGTLDVDEGCNVDHQVNGKYSVPVASVTMTNPASRPIVVVADCS